MQNKDLSRFFPDNPLSNKAFQFVRYNENGEIEGLIAGEVYIGTLTIDHEPSQSELSSFVESTVGRSPQVNDMIMVVNTSDGTTYKYVYNGTQWSGYEMPGVDLAQNGEPGIVSGTYGIGSNNELLVDIVDGVIEHIYVKSGVDYRDLVTYINANRAEIAAILNGSTIVPNASNATNDGNGNNIANTYQTKSEGATKQYVDNKVAAFKKVVQTVDVASNSWSSTSSYEGFGYIANIPLNSMYAYLASSNVFIDMNAVLQSKYGIILKEFVDIENGTTTATLLSQIRPTQTITITFVNLVGFNVETITPPTPPTPSISEYALFSDDGDTLIGTYGADAWELLAITQAVFNQVTDEFGNPVTDENGNPVVVE